MDKINKKQSKVKSAPEPIEVFHGSRFYLFLQAVQNDYVILVASWYGDTITDAIIEASIDTFGLTEVFPYLTYTMVEK